MPISDIYGPHTGNDVGKCNMEKPLLLCNHLSTKNERVSHTDLTQLEEIQGLYHLPEIVLFD